MTSTRIVPVTQMLLEEALEHYWRSIAMIKDNENVKIDLSLDGVCEATITTTKEVVEVFRL